MYSSDSFERCVKHATRTTEATYVYARRNVRHTDAIVFIPCFVSIS